MFGIFKKIKADGYIKYYNLEELWVNVLTDQHRQEVKDRIALGMNADSNSVDTGNLTFTTASKSKFLVTMAEGVKEIKIKDMLLQKALFEMKTDAVENHFVLMNVANEYKKIIKSDESFYSKQIDVLKKDCFLYDRFAKDYYKLDYVSSDEKLPSYPAFRELAIAYERTGEIQKAIDISELAMKKKVNEKTSFESRIEKLSKKLEN